MSSLYSLELRPLAEVSLANTVSHTVGSLFILMLFSLAMQKLFNLMRSHLSNSLPFKENFQGIFFSSSKLGQGLLTLCDSHDVT